MNQENLLTGVLIEETTTYTVTEVCRIYHIPKELLIEIIEIGLFPEQNVAAEEMILDHNNLMRLETAFRLHRDLDINLAGVALALELLDDIEQMRNELAILRKHSS